MTMNSMTSNRRSPSSYFPTNDGGLPFFLPVMLVTAPLGRVDGQVRAVDLDTPECERCPPCKPAKTVRQVRYSQYRVDPKMGVTPFANLGART